jgi:hypothetical protein
MILPAMVKASANETPAMRVFLFVGWLMVKKLLVSLRRRYHKNAALSMIGKIKLDQLLSIIAGLRIQMSS